MGPAQLSVAHPPRGARRYGWRQGGGGWGVGGRGAVLLPHQRRAATWCHSGTGMTPKMLVPSSWTTAAASLVPQKELFLE